MGILSFEVKDKIIEIRDSNWLIGYFYRDGNHILTLRLYDFPRLHLNTLERIYTEMSRLVFEDCFPKNEIGI